MTLAIAQQSGTFDAVPPVPRVGAGVGVRFSNLTKGFGGKTVLNAIDLDIPAGQFVAIIGKSGCGKSTLLRQLAKLDAPSKGEVLFGAAGEDAVSRIMFQEPRLLPWRRVLDNVAIGLPAAVRGDERRERSLSALAEVGLADRAGEWPSVLSGGQKQRVALARALVSRPQILSLDEPLGALDALTRIEMQDLIARIWLEQGFTAVLVTHDVSEAVALADRIILLDGGAVALDVNSPLARPRRRSSPASAWLEAQILERLLNV